MEAEFFGYRKGAFTGAVDDRDGFFQAASGGTLMLDEVADLPLAMQVKLLRAIQERRVRKIGATTEEPVDVRIVSATHQSLADCVSAGKFRQDLYYRLNVIELHLPPLRERLGDIAELSAVILLRLAVPGHPITLRSAALQALSEYDFPGNVRELENILERAVAFANDACIEVADLALRSQRRNTNLTVVDSEVHESKPLEEGHVFFAPELPCSLPDYLEKIERELISRALVKARYNRTHAAELLGVSFRQLRYQIQKLKIHDPQ